MKPHAGLFLAAILILTCCNLSGAEYSVQEGPESVFDRGMALAKVGKWEDAARVLLQGQKSYPADKRFPLELAGIAFKQRDHGRAKHHLRRALQIDPSDPYANDFMATLFYLDENLEAALKYWNRIGKPYVQEIVVEPKSSVDPVFLDRTFLLSPASTLKQADYLETHARIHLLDIFSRYRFELSPRQEGTFDVIFRGQPAASLSSNTSSLIRSSRGLPYQTLYADFYNVNHSALNLLFIFRWDAQKRRFFHKLSGSFSKDPAWRYNLFFDARNERWELSERFNQSGNEQLPDLKFEKLEAGAEFENVVNSRVNWSTSFDASYRRNGPLEFDSHSYFEDGLSLSYSTGIQSEFFRRPEQRFLSIFNADFQLGRFFSNSGGTYSTITAEIGFDWLPQPKGDDLSMRTQLRAGAGFGNLPFDQIFSLGMERDNPLALHGHAGTKNGKKGNAPLGDRFVLVNWEWNKQVYRNAFLKASLGPLLDLGRIYDSRKVFTAPGWMVDGGLQSKIKFFTGVTLTLSYARDLQTGNDVFYTSTGLPLRLPH